MRGNSLRNVGYYIPVMSYDNFAGEAIMARKNDLEDCTIQKLRGDRLSIFVFGEFGSGKSTLIHSIMSGEGLGEGDSFLSISTQLQLSPYHRTFMGVPTAFHEIAFNPSYEKEWMKELKKLIGDANNNLIIILCVRITDEPTLQNAILVSFSKFLYSYSSRSQQLNIMRKCILMLTHADHWALFENEISDMLEARKMLWCNVFKKYFQRYEHIIDNTPVCLAAKERTIPGTNVDWVSVLWFCCMEIFTGINDIVQNHTIAGHVTAQLHVAIEKRMKEGYVSLNNIKMVICGPPCVGKTAFRSLLLNNPRPLKHNSTPITARPVKAIERIAAGRIIWEEIGEEDLLHMLYDTICNTDELNESQSYFEFSTTTKPSLDSSSTTTISLLDSSSTTTKSSLDSSTTTKSSLDSSTTTKPSLDLSPPTSMSESTSSLLLSQPALPQQHSHAVHAPLSPVATPQPEDLNYVSKKIVKALAKERKGLQKLHEVTWIHLLDSGGQPQFTDLLRMFVRGNSIYIIVMKVTESLHEKPTFVYSIDGKPLNAPKEMTTTNLQIIESFVHSVAATTRDQLGDKSQPAFAIVATHCDQSRLRRLLGRKETIKEKNEELLSHLSEFLDLFIFYNRDSNELIFPVDNLCWLSREKISTDIRLRLLSTRSDISFSVEIPARWYVFDLNMKEEASKETHGMISLESCYTIGRKIGMDNSEVDRCLIYLDSMRLCIYYPNLLPHVVFTDPQFLVESLSNIVRVSFVDDLHLILPDGVSLSHDVILSLKKDGVFEESLLITLGLTFIPCLFSKSNLLLLLQHFRVISVIKAPHTSPTRYFIPILLPAERLPEEQKTVFSQKIDPLLITFNRSIVIQVSH